MTPSNTLSPAAVRGPWHRFLEEVEPLRPDLYRYCRYLTRSPWDAEDLVQDTMARAFVLLARSVGDIQSPRAWMFRVATNAWLNHVRGAREVSVSDTPERATPEVDPRATREAAGTLIASLSPQERAAVVLKDVFDFTLEEVAVTLSTSTGAIKAALHRGRGKLDQPAPTEADVPVPAVVTAFVEAFNARDLDRLVSLLLEDATMDFPGLFVEEGAEVARRGSLAGILFGDPSSDDAGIAPDFREGLLSKPPRLEIRVHRGEPLLLGWFEHTDGPAVRAISRLVADGDRVARCTTYLHQPEVLAEICRELGVPFRASGYRPWW